VLLVRTAKAGWELARGGVGVHEDPVQALVRETREDAVCEIEVSRLVSTCLAIDQAHLLLVLCTTSTTLSPALNADEDAL
jgi:ADP-ribose pyrophosphatase YjhB (NUDIX family)